MILRCLCRLDTSADDRKPTDSIPLCVADFWAQKMPIRFCYLQSWATLSHYKLYTVDYLIRTDITDIDNKYFLNRLFLKLLLLNGISNFWWSQ